MTDAMLGQNRQVLALEPFTGEQRAIVIEQKAFGLRATAQPPG
jgi:hypothetical protein